VRYVNLCLVWVQALPVRRLAMPALLGRIPAVQVFNLFIPYYYKSNNRLVLLCFILALIKVLSAKK
jgi:hypothetical protein